MANCKSSKKVGGERQFESNSNRGNARITAVLFESCLGENAQDLSEGINRATVFNRCVFEFGCRDTRLIRADGSDPRVEIRTGPSAFEPERHELAFLSLIHI